MLPIKQNITLSEFPINYFIAMNDNDKIIEAHPHWHTAIEILYVTHGTAKQQLGEHIFKIEKGDIVIIWSNQFHSTYSMKDEDCEIIVLQFNTDIFLNSFNSGISEKIRNIYFCDKIQSTCNVGAKLLDMIHQMIGEIKKKREGYDLVICGMIHLFLAEIIRDESLLPIYHVKKHSENDKMIAVHVFKYIEDNYNEDISLHKIATEVGLSNTHFLRVFKNVSGMTFKKYLNYYRVNKSIMHLQNGEGVTETAMKSGFSDINTYIRNFKKYKGSTPSKYK